MNIFGDNAECCDGDSGSGGSGIQVVADTAERDALTGMSAGDQVFVVSSSSQFIWSGTAWEPIATATNIITSVNSKTGKIIL